MTAPARILIVDDGEKNRLVLHDLIVALGHTPVLAEDGRSALEEMGKQLPDLVLIDIMMPEMDGYEVLDDMKADATRRHIPVIMISAVDELDSVVRCIEKGADDYLVKPFNPVLLRARIGACLEKKHFRDQEEAYRRQIEEEKNRSDGLLHAIFPPEIVEELKATGVVRPRRHENVAVLFCDVVGFTAYCERLPPEELVAHLQEMVEGLEAIASRHGLQKIKTIGDAFMATCGLLRPAETPVTNCVRAGLEMVAAVPGLEAGWQVRVGIHAGPVIAGVVGSRQYLFDVWGDTTNTAARVEKHGADGAVNLSDAAWRQLAGAFPGRSLGPVPMKGKRKTEIFRVSASPDG